MPDPIEAMEGARLNVLLVENDPVDREAILRFIRQQRLPYQVETAGSESEARSLLRGGRSYDIALLDYDLGDGTAFHLIEDLRDTPCIIVTARGGEQVAGEALRRGAYDYIVKDHDRTYLESLPSSITNVLARKHAEHALKESEARYQDLFDNAPDMYFQLLEDGTVCSVNRQGARELGYAVEELLGEPVTKVVHPDDAGLVRNQIASMLKEPERVHHINFRKVRKDGSILYVAESLSVQQEKGHRPVVRIICRDITVQVEAEERARQLQERLARSERMESIGILAGGVAHDLNNILGPMVAYPDLLLNHFEPGSEPHNIVLEIKRSAARATAVIRDLLTLARRGRYHLEPLDLNSVVESYVGGAAFAEFTTLFPAVVPRVRLAPGLPLISGSAVNLVKVIMNLVINAFEAMPHGGELVIETSALHAKSTHMGYESVPAGDYAVLKVADTGSGIAPADQGRIFEPFFTKKKMGRSGSGLGLSVVYGVVKDHGGFIDVRTEVGVGSVLMIYLPVSSEAPQSDSKKPAPVLRGTEYILVADDAEEQRILAVKLLADMGYRADTASSGRAVVERLRAHRERGDARSPYDLILLDMIMEEDFDGLDTYRQAASIYPEQRCIIVSGYAETSRVKEALTLGVGRYLAKPYTREELGLAVRHELDRAAR